MPSKACRTGAIQSLHDGPCRYHGESPETASTIGIAQLRDPGANRQTLLSLKFGSEIAA